ncbi:MAG: hypothetical protein WB680_15445 [Candidatus Acidiferrales bacterium]
MTRATNQLREEPLLTWPQRFVRAFDFDEAEVKRTSTIAANGHKIVWMGVCLSVTVACAPMETLAGLLTAPAPKLQRSVVSTRLFRKIRPALVEIDFPGGEFPAFSQLFFYGRASPKASDIIRVAFPSLAQLKDAQAPIEAAAILLEQPKQINRADAKQTVLVAPSHELFIEPSFTRSDRPLDAVSAPSSEITRADAASTPPVAT